MCKKIKLKRNKTPRRLKDCFFDGDIEICENIYRFLLFFRDGNFRSEQNDYAGDDIVCGNCGESLEFGYCDGFLKYFNYEKLSG